MIVFLLAALAMAGLELAGAPDDAAGAAPGDGEEAPSEQTSAILSAGSRLSAEALSTTGPFSNVVPAAIPDALQASVASNASVLMPNTLPSTTPNVSSVTIFNECKHEGQRCY